MRNDSSIDKTPKKKRSIVIVEELKKRMGSNSTHLVLVGDSTFDNKFYVEKGNPSIIEQLQSKVEERGWKASSFAVDGHSISHIIDQIKRIPSDSTHLIISIGGNDVLDEMNLLKQSVTNIGESLLILNERIERFEKIYAEMLDEVNKLSIRTIVCTIYHPNFENIDQQRMCETALTLFNGKIIRQSIKRGIPLIDLTTIFNEKLDYANHIEPDIRGGEKIVRNILFLLDHHRFQDDISSIYSK